MRNNESTTVSPESSEISGWVKEMQTTYQTTFELISQTSVLGGSVTFVAAVSANRGDISYMIYSFYFFLLGMAISLGLLVTLSWFYGGIKGHISHPRFWEGIVALAAMGGGACLILAFIFLVLCIREMNYHTSATQALSLNPVVYLGYTTIGIEAGVISVIFMFFLLRKQRSEAPHPGEEGRTPVPTDPK